MYSNDIKTKYQEILEDVIKDRMLTFLMRAYIEKLDNKEEFFKWLILDACDWKIDSWLKQKTEINDKETIDAFAEMLKLVKTELVVKYRNMLIK